MVGRLPGLRGSFPAAGPDRPGRRHGLVVFHRPALGFLGGAFFLILAPTPSVVPIVDLAFEHRMYLPLAAVAVAGTIAGYDWPTGGPADA